MRKTSPSTEAGFTLVEMMMAMLIMTVGLLGLLQSIQVAYRHSARNIVREEAMLVAYSSMNQFKCRPYDEITCSGGPGFAVRGARRFQVTREVKDVGGTPPGAKKLAVTVEWTFDNVTARQRIYTFKAR